VDDESAESCRGRFEMWTHNSTTNECQLFFWNGCGASENVFDSQTECQERCEKPQVQQAASPRKGKGEYTLINLVKMYVIKDFSKNK